MTHCLILQFWCRGKEGVDGWHDAATTDGEDGLTLKHWIDGESRYTMPYRIVRRMEVAIITNKHDAVMEPSLVRWVEKDCIPPLRKP